MSRAIGDFDFKKNFALAPEDQIITANPDVIEHQLTDEDEFLVLACDGKLIVPLLEVCDLNYISINRYMGCVEFTGGCERCQVANCTEKRRKCNKDI